MPTYEYKCDSCKYTFERFQSMTDGPITECPECGKGVRRLIGGGAGFIFKGKGFYQTDYKGSSDSTTSSGKDKDEKTPPCGNSEVCSSCDA